MKKKLLFFIIGIILGMVLMGLIVLKAMPGQMFRVVKSEYDFEETVSMLEEASYQNNWEVLHIYDLGECLFNEGYENPFIKVSVLSICQPEYSFNILQEDENKKIAAIMPCRIGVYEDKEGDVYLTRMNIGLFSKVFPGTIGEILKLVAQDDEKIVKCVMGK